MERNYKTIMYTNTFEVIKPGDLMGGEVMIRDLISPLEDICKQFGGKKVQEKSVVPDFQA